MKISDVIRGKSTSGVITISPGATVRDLLALLSEHNIGAVIVSDDGATVGGIVSERDVVRKLHGNDAVLDGPVEAIMTAVVQTCEPGHDVDELMGLMTEHRIRHVPVVENGELVAVISIGDVVKSRITQLEFERDQLDSYVHQT
ncbi:MAG: domain containing protein [Marmoricola sp.]|jgi:CBS domain-containing protein|nr:domain containing protein [Marmoricola sp.]